MFYMKEMTMKQKPKKKKKKKQTCSCDSDSDCEEMEDDLEMVDGMRDIIRPGILVKDLMSLQHF